MQERNALKRPVPAAPPATVELVLDEPDDDAAELEPPHAANTTTATNRLPKTTTFFVLNLLMTHCCAPNLCATCAHRETTARPRIEPVRIRHARIHDAPTRTFGSGSVAIPRQNSATKPRVRVQDDARGRVFVQHSKSPFPRQPTRDRGGPE